VSLSGLEALETAFKGHPRSLIVVQIKTAYVTSY